MPMAEWQEVLLLALSLFALPLNLWTLGMAAGARLELHASGRNGVLKLISNRDIREAGQRVMTSLALLIAGAILTQRPPWDTPMVWLRWGFQGSLVLAAFGALSVGVVNLIEQHALARLLAEKE